VPPRAVGHRGLRRRRGARHVAGCLHRLVDDARVDERPGYFRVDLIWPQRVAAAGVAAGRVLLFLHGGSYHAGSLAAPGHLLALVSDLA
jgi:hypothetical protein